MSRLETVAGMQGFMISGSHQEKVLEPVVILDAVNVMDHVTFRDGAVGFSPKKTVLLFGPAQVLHLAVSLRGYVASGSEACEFGLPHVLPRLKSMFPPVAKTIFLAEHSLANLLSVFGRKSGPKHPLAHFLTRFWRPFVNSTWHFTFNYTMNYIWKARGG